MSTVGDPKFSWTALELRPVEKYLTEAQAITLFTEALAPVVEKIIQKLNLTISRGDVQALITEALDPIINSVEQLYDRPPMMFEFKLPEQAAPQVTTPITVMVPEQKAPMVTVHVPEQKAPTVTVTAPAPQKRGKIKRTVTKVDAENMPLETIEEEL